MDSSALNEATAWDMYFGAVVSLQYHPANPPEQRMSLEELAKVADAMLEVRRCRLFGPQ